MRPRPKPLKNGQLVVLVGIDGSGKTTLAPLLAERLNATGRRATAVKIFDYVLWRKPLDWVRSRLMPPSAATEARDPQLVPGRKRWPLRWWPMAACIDHWWCWFRKVRPLLRQYDIVISDRYFYDHAAHFAYYGYGTPTIIEWYLRALPQPARVVVLTLDPAQAFRRAGELSPPYYEALCRWYAEFAQRYRLPTVNTDQPIPKVIDEILQSLN